MIPSFLTHYYEAERGPFKNICDLSDDELDGLISVEQDADTAFNRFARSSFAQPLATSHRLTRLQRSTLGGSVPGPDSPG
jgi:hypothetical protein